MGERLNFSFVQLDTRLMKANCAKQFFCLIEIDEFLMLDFALAFHKEVHLVCEQNLLLIGVEIEKIVIKRSVCASSRVIYNCFFNLKTDSFCHLIGRQRKVEELVICKQNLHISFYQFQTFLFDAEAYQFAEPNHRKNDVGCRQNF